MVGDLRNCDHHLEALQSIQADLAGVDQGKEVSLTSLSKIRSELVLRLVRRPVLAGRYKVAASLTAARLAAGESRALSHSR